MVVGSLPEQADLAVVGGGVGGYVAAIRAAQLGLSVVLVEKEKLGGHCLNYACIPSKTLLHIADILYEAKNAAKFGINLSGASIDAKKMLEWRMGVSKKLENGVAFLCKSNQVEVIKGTATFISSNSIQLTNGTNIEFNKAIIATGSEPTVLKGFEFGEEVLDYKQALMLDKVPSRMLIIGGGYVGVELATLYAKLGSKVTIAEKFDVLFNFDRDAAALVKKKLEELGVVIKTGVSPLSRIAGTVKLSDGTSVSADKIVVSVGLSPYIEGLGLENTKVELDEKGFIKVNDKLQTTDPNILAVGDVNGGPLLAHRAMRQGVIAAEVAAGQNAAYDNLAVPAAIFCDPEIATVGSVEQKPGITITKFPLSALGIAVAFDKTEGFVKIACDSTSIVRGVEIVGHNAATMISEGALAIELGATLEDIADTIHVHPTFSEGLEEASEGGLGRGIHFFYGKP